MKFGSVCSGIEAASTAWHPLGWTTAYVADIEPFPNAVLAQRFDATAPKYRPDHIEEKDWARALKGVKWGSAVPNYGDFTRIVGDPDVPDIDLLVGGTPCQAFSVAGARQGLNDDRGNLTLRFLELVHASKSLRWAVRENVPGVLSDDTNAFGCFLSGLVGGNDPLHVPGGGRWPDAGMVCGPLGRAAWRILDAQHFGLAQRRRRVFVVFCPGSTGGDPVAVLFERQGVQRDFAPGGEAGEGTAGGVDAGADGGEHCHALAPALTSSGRGVSRPSETRGQDPVVATYLGNAEGGAEDAPFLTASNIGKTVNNQTPLIEVAHTLRGEGLDDSEDGTGRGTPLVPVLAPTLLAGGNGTGGTRPPGTTVDNCEGLIPVSFDPQGSGKQTSLGASEDSTGTLGATKTPAICFSSKDYGADASIDLAPTLRAGGHTGSHANGGVGPAIAFALRGREGGAQAEVMGDQAGASEDSSGGSSNPYVASIQENQRGELRSSEQTNALTGGGGKPGQGYPAAMQASAVRRLTPRECERLQGFPDDHTAITWKGKEAPDGPRYKALGNSMAVPVMRWIGERIQAFEDGTLDTWRPDFLRAAARQEGGVAVPILEAGARTGKSTTDSRAGIGVGKDGDPMFTLQAGKQHAVGVAQ